MTITEMLNRESDRMITLLGNMLKHGWHVYYFWTPIDRPEKYRFKTIGMKTFYKKRPRVP